MTLKELKELIDQVAECNPDSIVMIGVQDREIHSGRNGIVVPMEVHNIVWSPEAFHFRIYI